MADKTLHDGKWLSLRVKEDPENGIHGYEYVHNVPGGGQGVAVLPYRLGPHRIAGRLGHAVEFLVVNEVVPPWRLKASMCALTGLCDKPMESVSATAARELYEESGYTATIDDLIFLGPCHVSKSSDTTLCLYAVDLTDAGPPEEPPKDGSGLESRLTTSWVADPYTSMDPVLATMWARLTTKLALRYIK